jgi:hypothetical protein
MLSVKSASSTKAVRKFTGSMGRSMRRQMKAASAGVMVAKERARAVVVQKTGSIRRKGRKNKRNSQSVLTRMFSGKYSSEESVASRNGNTVVDISIPPPSFKPVLLYFSCSPLF